MAVWIWDQSVEGDDIACRRACRGHPAAARCDDDGPNFSKDSKRNLENFSFIGFGSVRILIRRGGPVCVIALCVPWPRAELGDLRTHFSAGLNRKSTAETFLVKNVETVGSSIVSTTKARGKRERHEPRASVFRVVRALITVRHEG